MSPASLTLLRERIEQIAGDHAPPPAAQLDHGAPQPWPAAVHEVLSDRPARGILLAWALARTAAEQHRTGVWIGRETWPYPPTARRHGGLIDNALFVDARAAAERVWAADLAARCRAVAVVVADGSGLDMAASRRLQLAAAAGRVAVLLARPTRELKAPTAAGARWRVTPRPTAGDRPAWTLELLRCKGLQPTPARTPGSPGNLWAVETNRETGALCLAPAVGERTGRPADEPAPPPHAAAAG